MWFQYFLNHGVCACDVDINHLVRARVANQISVVLLAASGSFKHDHDLYVESE